MLPFPPLPLSGPYDEVEKEDEPGGGGWTDGMVGDEEEEEDEANDDAAGAAAPADEVLEACDQAGEAIGTPEASSPPLTAPATAAGASRVRPNLRFLTTGRRGALLGPSGMGSGL